MSNLPVITHNWLIEQNAPKPLISLFLEICNEKMQIPISELITYVIKFSFTDTLLKWLVNTLPFNENVLEINSEIIRTPIFYNGNVYLTNSNKETKTSFIQSMIYIKGDLIIDGTAYIGGNVDNGYLVKTIEARQIKTKYNITLSHIHVLSPINSLSKVIIEEKVTVTKNVTASILVNNGGCIWGDVQAEIVDNIKGTIFGNVQANYYSHGKFANIHKSLHVNEFCLIPETLL